MSHHRVSTFAFELCSYHCNCFILQIGVRILQAASLKFTGFWGTQWSVVGMESVVWWWQAMQAIFLWQVDSKNYGFVACLDWMCHFSCSYFGHQPVCRHGEQMNTVQNCRFYVAQFYFLIREPFWHHKWTNSKHVDMADPCCHAWLFRMTIMLKVQLWGQTDICCCFNPLIIVVPTSDDCSLSEQGLQGDGCVGQTCLRRLAHAWFSVFGSLFCFWDSYWETKWISQIQGYDVSGPWNVKNAKPCAI